MFKILPQGVLGTINGYFGRANFGFNRRYQTSAYHVVINRTRIQCLSCLSTCQCSRRLISLIQSLVSVGMIMYTVSRAIHIFVFHIQHAFLLVSSMHMDGNPSLLSSLCLAPMLRVLTSLIRSSTQLNKNSWSLVSF